MEGKFCDHKFEDCTLCLLVIQEKHEYEIKKTLKSIEELLKLLTGNPYDTSRKPKPYNRKE
jgi:Txe/YoeB family toxin of Txe-Axe toxin-antitoxin module